MATPQYPVGLRLPGSRRQSRRLLPVAELAELRKSEPIHWVDIPGGAGGFEDHGYSMVSKHADVKEILRRSDVFSNWENGAIPTWPKEMKRDMVEMQRSVMLNMDAPHHTRLRKMISLRVHPARHRATPRGVGSARAEHCQGRGRRGQWRLCRTGFVRAAAAGDRRPRSAMPQDDRDKLFRWSNEMTGGEDPEYADVDPAVSSMELIMYAMAMADERGKQPPPTTSSRP